MTRVATTCRLCLKPAQLMLSHIIPEFMYEETYDDKHRTLRVDRQSPSRPRTLQKGLRERLLCADSESRLSKYEAHAAPIVKSLPTLPIDPSGLHLESQFVDYRLFKLFEMSLLWRAAVSNEPLFAGAKLKKAEPRLQEMLAGERPGSRHDF